MQAYHMMGGEGREYSSVLNRVATETGVKFVLPPEQTASSYYNSIYVLWRCDAFCITHTNSGCGRIEAHKTWSKVTPEKAAPVTRTTLMTTGPAPADYRQ